MRAAEGTFLHSLLLAGSVCEAMVVKPALEPAASRSGQEHADHTGHVAKHGGKQSSEHLWPQSAKLLQQEWPWSRRPDGDLEPGMAPPSSSAAAPPSSAASAHHSQRSHGSSRARYHYGHKAAASARASEPRSAPGASEAPEPQPTPGAARFSEPQLDSGDTASTGFSEPQPGATRFSEPQPQPQPDSGARHGRPTHPGCWMKMPSGCPKVPMRTETWRHDTWAEQRGLDEGGCLRRKRTWDKYCDRDDADMLYIPNATVKEDLSALQIGLGDDWPPAWWPWSGNNDAKGGAAQATEAEYYWVDDGCHKDPKRPDDYSGAYVHRAQNEAFARCCSSDGSHCRSPQMCNTSQPGTHADAADACHKLGLRLCTKDELLSDMCCFTGGECDSFPVWTSSAQAAQPASSVAEPTKPGCYMITLSGCPKHPMTPAWRSDRWADQNNLDEAGCMERKITWDTWCGATDAQMKHVPSSRPDRAESGSALRFNKWQSSAEAAVTALPSVRDSHFDELIANPSEPGCYMRMPSECPKHPMRTHAWRHDTWAEQQDLDEKSCKERKIQWDNYCESNDAKAFYVPKQ